MKKEYVLACRSMVPFIPRKNERKVFFVWLSRLCPQLAPQCCEFCHFVFFWLLIGLTIKVTQHDVSRPWKDQHQRQHFTWKRLHSLLQHVPITNFHGVTGLHRQQSVLRLKENSEAMRPLLVSHWPQYFDPRRFLSHKKKYKLALFHCSIQFLKPAFDPFEQLKQANLTPFSLIDLFF